MLLSDITLSRDAMALVSRRRANLLWSGWHFKNDFLPSVRFESFLNIGAMFLSFIQIGFFPLDTL